MADVVTLFDLEMRQLYVSPSILRLRGYTPEESLRQEHPRADDRCLGGGDGRRAA